MQVVKLEFEFFDTEEPFDTLTIYDGDSLSASLITNLSGSDSSLLGPYMSSTQYMLLQFISDGFNTRPGFIAQYTITTTRGYLRIKHNIKRSANRLCLHS